MYTPISVNTNDNENYFNNKLFRTIIYLAWVPFVGYIRFAFVLLDEKKNPKGHRYKWVMVDIDHCSLTMDTG